jgi:hypothetical protein
VAGDGTARREAEVRIASAARVLAAMAAGDWPIEVGSIDALGALLDAAGRWALVAELDAA